MKLPIGTRLAFRYAGTRREGGQVKVLYERRPWTWPLGLALLLIQRVFR